MAGDYDIEGEIALTIGVFDGVHIGHKALIREITESGRGYLPIAFTFLQNPGTVIGSKRFSGNISTLRQRILRLEESGIEYVVLIDFSTDFSRISGEKFLSLLRGRLDIKKIAVGYNFKFGYKNDVDAKRLKLLTPGIELSIVDPILYRGTIVSSTRIREEIREGNFSTVREMLGYDYMIDLDKQSEQAVPNDSSITITRERIFQVLPKNGKYLVKLACEGSTANTICEIHNSRVILHSNKEKQCSSIDSISFIEKQHGRS
jgi:riboflavin kinase / FMN adenylyltransferase